MASEAILHVNVNCSDYGVSKAFYQNLGCRSVLDLPTIGDATLATGLAIPECAGRASIMMLDPGQPRQARLDLIEWVKPRDDRAPYDHLARLGINRIALWTIGLQEEYERLLADGVEFLSEPVMMDGHTLYVCLKDPDGTIIELVEFLRNP